MTKEQAIRRAIEQTRATGLTHLVIPNGIGGFIARMLGMETARERAEVEIRHISHLGQVVQIIEA